MPKGREFPLHRQMPDNNQMMTGLTSTPWANPASPAVKTLRAALMSRSWILPHSGHTHSRTFNGIFGTVCPQSEHRLLDGYQRSMPTKVRPYHSDLYSSCLTNSDQPASLIDFAKQWFFCMLLTARLSMAITWFSLTSRVESLCRKSLRVSAVLACSLATLRLALNLFAEPFCFFASRLCNFASLDSFLRNVFGAAIFSPVESMAKWVSPKSIPICPAASGFGITVSSQSNEAKYRPAASLDTVTVVGFAAFGKVRDQWIFNGASIFASFNALPSHLKALEVYSAACLSCLLLKAGYLARLAKKFPNAVCKCRRDCCTGTLETSFIQIVSGCFFNSVNKAEVSW